MLQSNCQKIKIKKSVNLLLHEYVVTCFCVAEMQESI